MKAKMMSVRKKFRKKLQKQKDARHSTLRKVQRYEKEHFLQWPATTINGVKQ